MKPSLLVVFVLLLLPIFIQGCFANDAPEIVITASATPATTPTVSPSLGDVSMRSSDGMRMVYVPAGEFMMGSDYIAAAFTRKLCKEYLGNNSSAVCNSTNFGDESPAHSVSLSGFWIDQTEVTNEQYQKCEQAGVCAPPVDSSSYTRPNYYGNPEFAEYPVIWVTWKQANDYCTWAGGRLPTESEWEYAARGPDNLTFPWGNTFDGTRLNYCDASCAAKPNDPNIDDGFPDTAPVGSFPTGNSWSNVYDMSGNVREWVEDWYAPYPKDSQFNPIGPATGNGRIPRGGSWMDLPVNVRSTNRGGNGGMLDYSRHKVGFRCAKSDAQLAP